MIGWLIIACEVLFWIFLLAGLCSRYILGLKKLGALLIFCTPIIDLLLIIATLVDINNGSDVSFYHGLASIYVGATIVYGHSVIKWADVRFAYRFAGGPPPVAVAKGGKDHAKKERIGWFKHLLAFGIGNAILLGMILFIGDPSKSQPLTAISKIWSTILMIDFIISFSYTIRPRKVSTPSKEVN